MVLGIEVLRRPHLAAAESGAARKLVKHRSYWRLDDGAHDLASPFDLDLDLDHELDVHALVKACLKLALWIADAG